MRMSENQWGKASNFESFGSRIEAGRYGFGLNYFKILCFFFFFGWIHTESWIWITWQMSARQLLFLVFVVHHIMRMKSKSVRTHTQKVKYWWLSSSHLFSFLVQFIHDPLLFRLCFVCSHTPVCILDVIQNILCTRT